MEDFQRANTMCTEARRGVALRSIIQRCDYQADYHFMMAHIEAHLCGGDVRRVRYTRNLSRPSSGSAPQTRGPANCLVTAVSCYDTVSFSPVSLTRRGSVPRSLRRVRLEPLPADVLNEESSRGLSEEHTTALSGVRAVPMTFVDIRNQRGN